MSVSDLCLSAFNSDANSAREAFLVAVVVASALCGLLSSAFLIKKHVRSPTVCILTPKLLFTRESCVEVRWHGGGGGGGGANNRGTPPYVHHVCNRTQRARAKLKPLLCDTSLFFMFLYCLCKTQSSISHLLASLKASAEKVMSDDPPPPPAGFTSAALNAPSHRRFLSMNKTNSPSIARASNWHFGSQPIASNSPPPARCRRVALAELAHARVSGVQRVSKSKLAPPIMN